MYFSSPRTLAELAEYVRRELHLRLTDLGCPELAPELEMGGEGSTVVRSICPIKSVEPGALTFVTNREYLRAAEASEAAAVIIPCSLDSSSKPFLRVAEPRLVFSIILELAAAPPTPAPAEPDKVRFKDRSRVQLGRDVVIGDWCHVGAEVVIGQGCRIYPHVFIDDHVTLGDYCTVYPNVTIFRGTSIGHRVIIHAGSVIGDDGFGYTQLRDEKRGRLYHLKNEHAGRVVIEDFVEIGSGVCIDRALIGSTVVGAGTKIDNQVHLAHNVQVGRDCIIVAQVGVAGSSSLGDRVFLLGQVGVKDGVKIGDDALVTARAMVLDDIPPGRDRWAGQPCQEAGTEWKQVALARKELPRLRDFFRLLRQADSFEELKAEFFKGNSSREVKEK